MALPKKKLGELLMELGLIDKDQLTAALAYQRQWGHRLGTSLVAKGFISEGTLTYVLSRSLGIPMVDLSQVQPQKEALKLLPAQLCETHEVVPLAIEGNRGRRTLVLAMSDPLNIAVQEEVAFTTGCKVKPVLASFTAIGQAIRLWIRGEPGIEIVPASYEAPVRRAMRESTGANEEPFTLVHRGGDEMIVSNPMNPGPIQAAAMAPTVIPGQQPAPVAFAAPPQTNPQNLQMPPARTPQPWTPQQALGQQQQIPAVPQQPTLPPLPPLPPLQGGSIPPYPPQPMPQQAYEPPRLPVAPAYGGVPQPIPQHDPVEELEKKFWALMRVLARKGMITKEEFLKELQG